MLRWSALKLHLNWVNYIIYKHGMHIMTYFAWRCLSISICVMVLIICLVHDIIATIFDNYIFIKITLTIIFLWNGKTITWSIYSQYTASFLLVHHASTFCQPYNAENRPEAGKTTDFSKDSMQYDRPYQGDVPRRQGYVFSRFYRSVLGLQLI